MVPETCDKYCWCPFTVLSILMNVILRCSIYPSQWRTSIVSAIFKNKGCSFLPKFYRPISLVHLLSKFMEVVCTSLSSISIPKVQERRRSRFQGVMIFFSSFFFPEPAFPVKINRQNFLQNSIFLESTQSRLSRLSEFFSKSLDLSGSTWTFCYFVFFDLDPSGILAHIFQTWIWHSSLVVFHKNGPVMACPVISEKWKFKIHSNHAEDIKKM